MFYVIRKYSRRVFLLLAVCFSLTISAFALDTQSAVLLSSTVASTSGSVPSAAAVNAAAKLLAVQRAEEARAEAIDRQVDDLLYGSIARRTVAYDSSLEADDLLLSLRPLQRPLGRLDEVGHDCG